MGFSTVFYGNSVALVSSMIKRRASRRTAAPAGAARNGHVRGREGPRARRKASRTGLCSKMCETQKAACAVSVAVFSAPKHRLEA